MDLNGVKYNYSSYTNTASNTQATSAASTDTSQSNSVSSAFSDVAATYEHASSSSSVSTSSTDRSAIIAQMKADTATRVAQMQSLVTEMFSKQGITIGTADDMWKMLAEGNFTADEETIAQAKEDVSEDGYWGVKQTSERIFDFAMALSGGDEEKMKEMQEAFEKGFKEATKAWGKDLPSISNDTYDAVTKKFEDYFNGDSE